MAFVNEILSYHHKAVSKGKDSSETISKEKPSSQVSKDKHTISSHG